MEVEVQDREQVDSERESRGERDKGRRQNKETTNERSNMKHHEWHVDGVNAHAATP